MGIFSFKKAHEPADRKTAVSTDATASGLVPPPAADMTPPRMEPPRAIAPMQPPAPAPATTHDPVVPDPLKTLELKPKLIEALSTVYDPEIPVNILRAGAYLRYRRERRRVGGNPHDADLVRLPRRPEPAGRGQGQGEDGARCERRLGRRGVGTDVGHEQDVRRGEATGGVVVDLEVSKPQAEVGTGAGWMTGPVGRVRRAHGSPECCGWSPRSPGR